MDEHQPGSRLGLPLWAVLGLASLAVPRVILHDFEVSVGPLLQAFLAIGPPVIWVVVAVRARVPSPVITLVTVGSLYGIALAIVHNLMWDTVFANGSPQLGGALAGELPDGAGDVFLRTAMTLSSVFTGMILGLIAGVVATGIRQLGDRRRGSRR